MTSHVSVNVKARPEGYWTNTGVQISAGDYVTVQYVSGNWTSNPYWHTNDAAGNSKYIAGSSYLKPGAPEGALIGKVGGNNSDGGSETFLIGNLASVPADLTGTLWLTVNDEKKGFGDNHGDITVQISVNGIKLFKVLNKAEIDGLKLSETELKDIDESIYEIQNCRTEKNEKSSCCKECSCAGYMQHPLVSTICGRCGHSWKSHQC